MDLSISHHYLSSRSSGHVRDRISRIHFINLIIRSVINSFQGLASKTFLYSLVRSQDFGSGVVKNEKNTQKPLLWIPSSASPITRRMIPLGNGAGLKFRMKMHRRTREIPMIPLSIGIRMIG
nr:PREDICTED: uncharacterized protein LOC108212312 [Daucus carota subsp. sativus]